MNGGPTGVLGLIGLAAGIVIDLPNSIKDVPMGIWVLLVGAPILGLGMEAWDRLQKLIR